MLFNCNPSSLSKKLAVTVSFLFFAGAFATAQQNVGIGTNTPDASALLDVTATNKGILIPRVTNAQMIAIATPANGLLVYNTDSAAFAYRNVSAWVFLKGNNTASNDWSTKGNAGTDTSKNFIGTTDLANLVFKRNNLKSGLLSEFNTSFGYTSLYFVSSGINNTAFGAGALTGTSTGNENTAVGLNAMNENRTGSSNTAVGILALQNNKRGYSNVAVGSYTLYGTESTSNLVAIGDSALYNNYEGNSNTAIGSKTLFSNTSGSSNTANGFQALYSNTTAIGNTGIGSFALKDNTTGSANTAIGVSALSANIDGYSNTAIGGASSLNNTSGFENVAMGNIALANNSNGNGNTAIGYGAGNASVAGDRNVFVGYNAGYNETGSNKLYIDNSGGDADGALIYGEFDNKLLRLNARVGIGIPVPEALLHLNNTNTDNNASQFIIEGNSGFGNSTISAIEFRSNFSSSNSGPSGRIKSYYTSNNYTDAKTTFQTIAPGPVFADVMTLTDSKVGIGTTTPVSALTLDGGFGDAFAILNGGDVRMWNDDASGNALLYASTGTGNGNAVFTILSDGKTFSFTGTGGSVSSDERLKQDIEPLQGGLQKLMQLNGYSYRFKTKANNPQKEIGLLAQEVKQVLPEAVTTNDDGTYGVSYNSLVPVLINALKEQQKEMEEMKTQMKTMMERMKKLNKK